MGVLFIEGVRLIRCPPSTGFTVVGFTAFKLVESGFINTLI